MEGDPSGSETKQTSAHADVTTFAVAIFTAGVAIFVFAINGLEITSFNSPIGELGTQPVDIKDNEVVDASRPPVIDPTDPKAAQPMTGNKFE